MQIRTARTGELDAPTLEAIGDLMMRAFEGDFAASDWEHTLGGWHVIVTSGDRIASHAAVVPRRLEAGGRTWRAGYVEGVATDPPQQGRGLATAAMEALGDLIRRHHDFAALSTEAGGFYERLGWQHWQGPTYVRSEGELVRTASEDDGIMVLRFGDSADVDLASAIICEARTGDDW